jgi:signal transduction histidine kinase
MILPPYLEVLAGIAAGLTIAGVLHAFARARWLRSRLDRTARPMHELRGAITTLNLALSALERTLPSAQRRHFRIDALRSQLDRAHLAVSDLDAGQREVARDGTLERHDQLDLGAVVRRSTRAWAQLASTFGGHLDARWNAGAVRVFGSEGRLSQALDNLIGNALEHGGGRVVVHGERHADRVRITIVDEGRGLTCEPSELPESPPGSARGHGLAIARDVIERHGGTLAGGRNGDRPALVIELPARFALRSSDRRAA